jgi:peptidoglycan/LPS O-acetylase OafA/YrhL
MNDPDVAKRIYFKNLDVLRFMAAYMIVLLHCFFGWKAFFGHPSFIASSSPQLLNKIETIVHNFSLGVDIFFIVSGFLITYLLLSEKEKTGKVDIVKFYIRRAFRIWPLYFLIILMAPLLSYFFYEQSPDYLYQFLFAGNFDVIQQGTKSVATDHLWSICIEEHFYLFSPLLIAFIPLKKLPQVLLAIIFISIIFRVYISTTTENYGMVLHNHTLSRMDVLAIGSLFGYLYYYQKIQFDHPLSVRLIIYSIFILIFLNVDYSECGTFFTAGVKKYFFVVIVCYWAGNFLFNPRAKWAISKPNILHRFGKMSYGIYIFNPVLIFLILKLFSEYSYHNYLVFLILVHVTLIATISLSYRFIELPFLALKEKYAIVKSGIIIKNDSEKISGVADEQLIKEEVVPVRALKE